ncbi:MAG: two-component system, sensor histidine kinase and response regulator [Gaiellales bacterium]|nr:two-component system, sensor histidine kinase and response regulator [Gaiellales bacterium]
MFDNAQSAADRRLRVLLVDDDAANRELESLMLQHLGHQVDSVADGAEALTALAASSYDAVLMDCHMPFMDGFEATAAIRGAEVEDVHIPIIGLTSHDGRQRCVEAGMDDHLAKPFVLDALSAVLERVAPPAAGSFGGVLDAAIVEQLQMLAEAGSSGLLARLQAAFARDTPARLAALRNAIATGDRDAIAFNAHTLKGSAANLGAIRIVAACKAIEDASESAPERLEQMTQALEQAAADANAALAHLAGTG